MPTNDVPKSDGQAKSSVSRKAGTPKRTVKATAKSVPKADLDALQ